MRRYGAVALALSLIFLALFGIVEAAGVPLLTDPKPYLEQGLPLAATVGVGLLLVDVLLPVPSSVVMVAHGYLFGAFFGTLLSLVGSLGATAVAFGIGRRGGPLLHRLVSEAERARADALFARYGALALIASRPVPILAETLAILAGTSPLSWGRALLAAALGLIPTCLAYAIAGATATDFTSGFAVFGVVMVITGLFWLVGRRLT